MTGPDPEGNRFAETLIERALAAGAGSAQAHHTSYDYFEIDAETDAIALVRTAVGEESSLTVFQDGCKGSAAFSGRKDEDIEAAVAQALAAAAASKPDPAHGIAEAASQPGGDHGRPAPDRQAMVETARNHIALMAERYPDILTRHCVYSFTNRTRRFCNSAGLQQAERRGFHEIGLLFAGRSGQKTTSFNFTGVAAYVPFSSLIEAGSVRRSIEETLRAFDPQPVTRKFTGDVIITPDCLAGLIGSLTTALSGYSLLSGTTPYLERRGELIASPKFSLLNQPRSETLPGGADFDGFGVPTENRELIRDGRLSDFLIDFYISAKLDRPQTAGRTNLVIPAGTRPLDDIVAETDQGILLSRFSGGRPNDKLDFSGIAKNSFYIEKGEIRHALTETMVSGNLQDLLLDIRDLSQETVNFGSCEFPFLAAGGVTISSH